MHPPLDRPHPECQDVVQALKKCHANNSKVFFWRCDDAKTNLDKCFREEKKHMLDEMNKNFAQDRSNEDVLIMEALGQKVSFQEYLEKDKGYAKAQQENAAARN